MPPTSLQTAVALRVKAAQRGYVFPNWQNKDVDYIDVTPKPFKTQISLVEYFERIKRLKADRWQHDFCRRLQAAAENRHLKTVRASIHAESQLGKSSILAQAYPAWLLGHDPLHRIALATYNVSRSQAHSKSVIGIMNLPIHKEIFNNSASFVPDTTSKEKWQTLARRKIAEPQDSFNPVGLQSGLTGSGFDTLIIDDPYSDQKEAFSDTTRKNLQEFWDFTVMSRISQYSNVFGMFHRYAYDDLAGYLLDTGKFDYWRYGTVYDGPYIHEETGQKFDDPLGREVGEYISERRKPDYYEENKRNKRVWMSMFMGRPSAEEGEFFNVGKIKPLSAEEETQRRAECTVFIRSWDLAATEAAGDYSVGGLWGMSPDKRITLFDLVREQVDTAGRDKLQKETAIADGPEVIITVPQDPGAGGKSVVFHIEQNLQGFTVVTRPTTGSKEDRARNLAGAVNSGDVSWVTADWNRDAKKEFRDFPLSDHDDIIDAAADAYNEAYERVSKGLLIKSFSPRNLKTWDAFTEQFKSHQIPEHWHTYAALKVTPEATTANSGIIVARAAQNTNLDDVLFVVAEYKAFTANYAEAFEWLDSALLTYCAKPKAATIWLHSDSINYRQTIHAKMGRPIHVFEKDKIAGITELNWYMQDHLFGLVEADQLTVAANEQGLCAFRQEASTWGFTDKGEPSAIGAVLDCLRMIAYCFRTQATPKTIAERIEDELSDKLKATAIEQEPLPDVRDTLYTKRLMEVKRIEAELTRPIRGAAATRFGRR